MKYKTNVNMKNTLTVLFLLSFFTACNLNQKQFETTLNIQDSAVSVGQIDTAIAVLKKRLLTEGYKNCKITSANGQIKIQSPKLEEGWINNYLLKKGALVFYECYTLADVYQNIKEADKIITAQVAKKNDNIENPFMNNFQGFAKPFPSNIGNQFPGHIGYVLKENIGKLKNDFSFTKDVFPIDAELFFQEQDPKQKKYKLYNVYLLKNNTTKFFVNNHLTKSEPTFTNGYASISITFDAYGTTVWRRMTTANVNKAIAIVIDNNILSVPNVNGPIDGGKSEISGVFDKKQAVEYADILNSGHLPLQLSFVKIQNISSEK